VKAPIWGTADEGEKVTLKFQDQEVSTAAKNGKWEVRLDNLKPGGPFELTITGSNTIQIKNVLVGEVWVCSGQSNMEWPVSFSADPKKAIEESANPMIRLFTVPKSPASAPVTSVNGNWVECGPNTVGSFSAVAYFFGRDLQKALNVPVGLIHTSWGGTPAESWTSREALEAEPSLKYMAENQKRALAEYPKALERHIQDLTKYKDEVVRAAEEGREPPPAPAQPANPAKNAWGASTLYNGMIANLIPYGIRGAIWYQGESNAGRAYEYRTLLPTMIKNWRHDWGQGDFPFLIVQLAPFLKIEEEPKDSEWAELREAQLLTTLNLPNTAQAVITDVGEETDIHPRKKEPVGARLALAARALGNGEKIEFAGPVYSEMKIEGDKIVLSFKHLGGGLVAKGEQLTGFTIAGSDRKFVKAEAEIQGDNIVVRSPQVAQPVAVRFGWANYPVVNLWNKAGLPASPFRTDDFPMLTNKTAAKPR
jgi:sialate O-acetylesterase